MAVAEPRAAMNNIIQEVIAAGTSSLKSPDAVNPPFDFSNTSNQKPAALARIVEALTQGDPELKVSMLDYDKYVMQRGYGTTSFIYLANGKK